MKVYRAANADAQVDGCPNEGEHEVVADAGMYLPASLDLRQSEEQQPGHDDEHADPDDERDDEIKNLDEVSTSLRIDERRRKPTVVSQASTRA